MVWRSYPMPAAADIRLDDIMRALADPGRLRMVAVLADGKFHDKGTDLFGPELQRSTVSHHLKTMREAGLTETRIDGRRCDIRLRRDELDDRFPGLVASLTSPAALADLG